MLKFSSVLFDIGNVFVEWDPRLLYRELISDSEELEYFLKNIVTLEWHTEHDRGRSFAEGVRILSAQYPEYADLIAVFDERWNDTIGPVIPGMPELLEELVVAGIPVYALTNFSAEKWPEFCRKYSFTDHFEGVVVSGEVGLIKPDPKVFEVAIERFNLVPEETYFIDDRLDNVNAAKAAGMTAHQFKGLEGLLADIRTKPFKALI